MSKLGQELTFSLEGNPYIELNKLLKLMSVVNSGGEAKMIIRDGQVIVNEEVELRLRRKMIPKDLVSIDDISIVITE
ncbi:MAG: ribosome-associated protein [Saprospiraceae bacterium]